tara:strand:+ start:194 stop:418 length:225 start_codon:yes stop_codon:yes gene_type:complete
MIKTYLTRAENSEALSKDQYRHESNAFWHLAGQISYLQDTAGMKGHELNRYAKHVLERLQKIHAEIESVKPEVK